MAAETVLVKPVVDALLALFREGKDLKLQRNAEAALREAIRELLLANPNDNRAEARIAVARAAGILSEDVLLAEDMLRKHRATKSRTAGKSGSSSGRSRKPATKKPAKKAIADTPAKKVAKKATKKVTKKSAKPADRKTP